MKITLFLLFIVDLSVGTIAQHYTCPSNEDCVKHCTTISCINYNIQASNAANLYVTCSNGYCSGIQISCPYDTTATCSVECTNNDACKNAVVNYPQPQNVHLKCSGSSACTGLRLLGPETHSGAAVLSSATIQCLGASTCLNAMFDLNYVHNVDISCQSTESTTASCDRTKIYTKYVSDVAVVCHPYACRSLYIDGTNVTNEITLDCTGEQACGGNSSIHVQQTNHFTLKCANNQSCLSVEIYPNQDDYHTNEISCAGTGCYGVTVHVDDDYILNYLDFTTTTTTLNSVGFVCSSRGASHLFYNETTQQFECDVKRCCPWSYGDIVCANNNDHGNCTVHCVDKYGSNGCRNKVIDAVNATTLNVICNSINATYGGCEGSVIFCPRNMVHKYGGDYLQCNVNCVDIKSCWAARVSSYYDDQLNIVCNNDLSCALVTVNAIRTKQSNLTCVSTNYYDDIKGIEYPYHKTYKYVTSFTHKHMNGWACTGNSKDNSCSFVTYSHSHCLRIFAAHYFGTNYYQYANKSFDMTHASNIKLEASVAHGIWHSGSYAYIKYDCGYGWTLLEGFCSGSSSDCPYTHAGYYNFIERKYALPSQCNQNPNVHILFGLVAHSGDKTYYSANFYVKDVTVVGVSDKIYMGSCCNMNINAQNQSTFVLKCEGITACVNNTINVQHAKSVTTTMIGTQSDIKSVINAQSSDVLNVNCGSRYSAHFVDACWHTLFYGNDKANRLHCESYGCNSLNLYSVNGIADWNITINGCMESQNLYNSVSQWCILCGNDYTSPTTAVFNGKTCNSSACGCTLLYGDSNRVTSSYDTIDGCTLETPDIVCANDANDCDIHCTNCSETAVTGAASKSLTVLCDDSCYKSLIYCPFYNECKVQCDAEENVCDYTEIYGGINEDIAIECKHNKSCNFIHIYANISANIDIYCFDYYSCNAITVHANTGAENITMHCFGYYSCNNIIVYAMNVSHSINMYCESLYSCNSNAIHGMYADEVNINCNSNYSCNNMSLYGDHVHNLTLNCLTNTACNDLSLYAKYSEIANINCYSYHAHDASNASCNRLSFYGSHVSSRIDWRCFGDYACSHNEVHAEYANVIDLVAYGDRALYYGHVFAHNANKYNISCLSSDSDMFTCFSSTMQGPAKDTNYPYNKKANLHCYGHGCYSLNLDSDSGFDDWVIYFNGCGTCNDITSCFDYWYLTCSDFITLHDHWKLNYYFGDKCKYMTSDACKCVSYMDILSQQFVNDFNENPSLCDFQVPYLSFTTAPTQMPTPSPSQHPSNDPSHSPIANPTKSPSQPRPTTAPTYVPTHVPTGIPTNTPSNIPMGLATNVPIQSPSNNQVTVNIASMASDVMIQTNHGHKTGSQSDDAFAAMLKDNLLYIAIVGAAFVCCLLICCGAFVCIYRKKDKQMRRVADDSDPDDQTNGLIDYHGAQTNATRGVEIGLTVVQTRSKRGPLGREAKKEYEKITD
eukprot:69308_1